LQQDVEINIMNSSRTNSIYTYTVIAEIIALQRKYMYFNRTCLRMKSVPKFAQLKILTNSDAAKKTQTQAQTLRIKNKINYYTKRSNN
jgi:hypothetical protein